MVILRDDLEAGLIDLGDVVDPDGAAGDVRPAN